MIHLIYEVVMYVGLQRRPYQRTIKWVKPHNQYPKEKRGVSKHSRWESMEIRAWSPKSKKYKDVESSIFRARSPKYLKRSSYGILDLWSRSGRGVLNLLRHGGAWNRGVESLFSERKISLMDKSQSGNFGMIF